MDPLTLLQPALIGAVVAALVLLATAWFAPLARSRAALALLLGFGAARLTVGVNSSRFPPEYGQDWMAYLVVAVLIHLVVEALLTRPKVSGAAPAALLQLERVVLGLVGAWLILSPLTSWRAAPLWIAVAGLGVAATSVVLPWLAARGPRWLLLGATGVSAAAAAAAIGVHYSGVSGGQVIGALALTSTVVVALTWRRDGNEVGPLFAAVFAPLLGFAVLTAGAYSSDFPTASLPLFLAVPACAFVAELPALAPRPVWQRVALGGLAALAMAAAATAVATPTPDPDDPYADYR